MLSLAVWSCSEALFMALCFKGEIFCQISSVTKGMKGWSKCNDVSKTRARLIHTGETFSPSAARVISGLTHSTYQSQNSCQKK